MQIFFKKKLNFFLIIIRIFVNIIIEVVKMIETTDALILQGRKFGDSSKIIVALTKNSGIISLIAKGALKPKNKFGSSIEPLNCSSLTFYRKRGDLHLLTDSETVVSLRNIKNSFEHLAVSMLILESITHSQIDIDHSSELFDSALLILQKLNELTDNPFNYFIYFQLIHAQILGFEIYPYFNSSLEVLRFAVDYGTYLENVNSASRKLLVMPINLAINLLNIYETDLNDIWRINLDKELIIKFYDFFIDYYSFHLDKKINFASFSLLETIL